MNGPPNYDQIRRYPWMNDGSSTDRPRPETLRGLARASRVVPAMHMPCSPFEFQLPSPYPDEVGLIHPQVLPATGPSRPCIRLRVGELVKGISQPPLIWRSAPASAEPRFTQESRRTHAIIDLPMTNSAQACFLGGTLGPDAVSLRAPFTAFLASSERDDLVWNVRSMTERSPYAGSGLRERLERAQTCFSQSITGPTH